MLVEILPTRRTYDKSPFRNKGLPMVGYDAMRSQFVERQSQPGIVVRRDSLQRVRFVTGENIVRIQLFFKQIDLIDKLYNEVNSGPVE